MSSERFLALTYVALHHLLRSVIIPSIALLLTLAGYRPARSAPQLPPTTPAKPLNAYAAGAPTYTELKARCYAAGLRPGHSRVSAAAALRTAGLY